MTHFDPGNTGDGIRMAQAVGADLWHMNQMIGRASLHSGFVRAGYYDWSPDNSREVAKGWIKKADSVDELAKLAGVCDPAARAETVARYNAGCASGADEFGRPPETLVPLDSPPYYCVPLFPGGPNTCGGPRKDKRARVLDAFGAPIPGLYAAGELGEAVGLLYPANGANLPESICFGRIAAADALGVAALPLSRGVTWR